MQITKYLSLLALLIGLISSAPAPGSGSVTFPGASSDDFYEDGPQSRHLFGHRRKKQPHHNHSSGGHGCRGHGCGGGYGWQQPGYGGYYTQNRPGSFATASAGTAGLLGNHHPSQANAQSASFNFGPYSATFSIAQASTGSKGFRNLDYYDH